MLTYYEENAILFYGKFENETNAANFPGAHYEKFEKVYFTFSLHVSYIQTQRVGT